MIKKTTWVCKKHNQSGEWPTGCTACIGRVMGKIMRKLDIKPSAPGWENFKWDKWKDEWDEENEV